LSDSTAEFVPDIATLSPDGRDKDLGHCLGSFVNDDGSAHPLCCRSHLKRLAGELAQVGLSLEVGTELNFYLFEESPTVARQQKWRNLTPVTASPISHSIRNSRLSADFMMQARKRLDFRSIEWDG
jgi:glutamine synthetase